MEYFQEFWVLHTAVYPPGVDSTFHLFNDNYHYYTKGVWVGYFEGFAVHGTGKYPPTREFTLALHVSIKAIMILLMEFG